MATKIPADHVWLIHAVTAFLLVTEDALDDGRATMTQACKWGGNIVPASWFQAARSETKDEFVHHFAQGILVVAENHRRFLEAVLYKIESKP